tara:strand:+ start:15459 stop:16454 length:996 start_codon:yes stop_codon:yes gene_type:complete
MQIRSNFKNMPAVLNVVTHVGAPAYLFLRGDNGSGKSAIVHSVEWALTGLAADAGGRDIKSKSYVHTLACGTEAKVEVKIDNRLYVGGDHPPYHNVMSEALAAIGGSSTALVDYLLAHGSALDEIETDVSLDYMSWENWVKSEGGVRRALARIRKAASSSLSKARAEVKEAKTVLKYADVTGVREILVSALKAEKDAKRLKNMCDAAALSWTKQVSAYVAPDYLQFHFGKNEVRLGLKGNGPVPSGAELVEAAIHLAKATRDPSTSVYVLPDRAYDPSRLSHLMRLLRMIPAVIVIAQSPIEPDESYDYQKFWATVDVSIEFAIEKGKCHD